MYTINDSTPLGVLTVGQFRDVFAQYVGSGNATEQNSKRHYEYGLRGLAKIFDCSIPTAQRIKASGKIDAAIVQTGRKIVIDADKALELAADKTK